MKYNEILQNVREEKKDIAKYLKDDENFRFEIATLITEARMYANFTQEDLSHTINTKQPSIARWEAAQSLPSLRSLKKIADALGTYLIPPKFGFSVEINMTQVGQNSFDANNAHVEIDNVPELPLVNLFSSDVQREQETLVR